MHAKGSGAYGSVSHAVTQQGIANLTDGEAAELIGRDRESHGRDL